MQNDEKDFKDYIETLPPEIKQAIYSIDYPKKLQEIVAKNKLMIDQAGKLEAETTLVMAGIEKLDDYVKNLVAHAGLSNIQASVVANDVNESIFKGIREALKKINEQIIEEDKYIEEKTNNVTQENVLAGIENPKNIKEKENSVSLSSLKSNSANPETNETIDKGVEIRINNLPEIAPEAMLPMVSASSPKPTENYHQNIAPVQNIIESKLTNTVIVPKETIVIQEKTKLPEKTQPQAGPSRVEKKTTDAYREPII